MSSEPPQTHSEQPAAVTWFKVYSGFLCLLYLGVAAMSLFFFLMDPVELEMSALGARLIGVFLLGMGLVLFAACLLPLLFHPRPWLWTYDLVIICLGMTSACFLPVCIPLLIYWLKPQTKRFFSGS
jgi:hypothetical protein